MAVADSHGLFWDSEDRDRTYDSESFERWLKKFFTTGVFENDLAVTAAGGMSVTVAEGYANVQGKVGFWGSSQNITLEAASAVYPRIDTIVIERNDTDREISIHAVTGGYSGGTPKAADPVRTSTVYQLVLAEVYIAAGASEVTQAQITDKRESEDVCGIVASTMEGLDIEQVTAQLKSDFAQWYARTEETAGQIIEEMRTEAENLVEEMQDILDGSAAGRLQLEIDALSDKVEEYMDTIAQGSLTREFDVTVNEDGDVLMADEDGSTLISQITANFQYAD